MFSINRQLGRFGVAAPVLLRLVIGALMAYHGFKKFDGGLGGVEEFFGMVDVPWPAVTAPLVAIVEVVGGLALIVGAATRLAALSLAGVLVGAILFVKADLGVIAAPGPMPGAELDLALLAGLLAVVVLGPGKLSVDQAIGVEAAGVPGVAPTGAGGQRSRVRSRG